MEHVVNNTKKKQGTSYIVSLARQQSRYVPCAAGFLCDSGTVFRDTAKMKPCSTRRFTVKRATNEHKILILIYLLTATGLTPGGSSTVHIYTQTIHRTTQLTLKTLN